MKIYYLNFILLLLFSNCTYGQIDSTFSELRGYEDNLNVTQLFYRVNSSFDNGTVSERINNIYNYNLSENRDSIFLYDKSYSSPVGTHYTFVTDFQLVNSSLSEYYYAGSSSSSFEPVPMLFYNKINLPYSINSFHGETSKVIVDSSSDENKIYVCVTGSPSGTFQKSEFSNNQFDLVDSLENIYLLYVLYKPDLIYFAMDKNGNLLRAKDSLENFKLVDSTKTEMYYYNNLNNDFIHDADNKHLYRKVVDRNINSLLVSDHSGAISSWAVKYQSSSNFFFCNDNTESGCIYLAEGNIIYKSENFAESFSVFKEFDETISGIYKKPGGNLYVITATKLLELADDKLNILRSLNSGISFYPLQVGNRWWYKKSIKWMSENKDAYFLKEIISKEILNNGFEYFKIKETGTGYDRIYFERIDSTTGMLYRNENEFDAEIVNLNMKYGETLKLNTGSVIKYSSTRRVLFQKKVYDTKNYELLCCEYGGFSLIKNIGVLYQSQNIVDTPEEYDTLIGGVINGVVFGDTTKVGIYEQPIYFPANLSLKQNYPNPFNPNTKIRFSIPENGMVTLKVFDILGREVETLINKEQIAGNYEVEFNGTNYTSGLYFYQLQYNNSILVRKMLILK